MKGGPSTRRAIPWATIALVAASAGAARAKDADPIHPGERVFGELAAASRVSVALDATAGTRLDLTCTAWRGDDLEPRVSMRGPDGAAVDVSSLARVTRRGRRVTIAGLVLTEGGRYEVVVAAEGATSGGFDLVTRGRRVLRFAGTGAAGDARIEFAGLPDDVAKLTVRQRRGTAEVVRLVDPLGAATAVGAPPPYSATLTAAGGHVFDVTATAAYSWKVALRAGPVRRDPLDADAIRSKGSIAGTIRIDGEIASAAAAPAAKPDAAAARASVPGEVIVAVLPGKSRRAPADLVREVSGDASAEVVRALSATGPYLVRVPRLAGARTDAWRAGRTRAVVRGLARTRELAWAAGNDVIAADATPNDPLWTEQSVLRTIRMPEAWDLIAQKGVRGDEVVVAVVDNGRNDHPDLAGVLLPGYDFVTSPADGDGWDADPTDPTTVHHGVSVAGVIGAVTNNQTGIAGALPKARILPVRVILGTTGVAFDMAAGIRWAAGLEVPGAPPNQNPARVMNCSFGGPTNAALIEAAEAANAAGCLVVASAGNKNSSVPQSPADAAGAVAVGALSADLTRAPYSNHGSWVTLSAPGTLLTVTVNAGGQTSYGEQEGTSFSSPQVAAVAALLFAVNPDLTTAQAAAILSFSSAPLTGDLRLLDAASALQYAASTLPKVPIAGALPARVEAGRLTTKTDVHLRNLGTGELTLTGAVTATTDDGGAWLSVTSPAVPAQLPLTVEVGFDQSALADGVRTGVIRFPTSAGELVVPVRLVRTPPPSIGFVRVLAHRTDGTLAATAVTSAALGWRFRFDGLTDDAYALTAETDADGTLAVDRVDEWSGAWPSATSAERIAVAHGSEVSGADFTIRRLDAAFATSGVTGGPVRGALAVRVIDAASRAAVPGARVYVGDAIATSVTDARGRAVVTGSFAGAQTVTVVADGYALSSRFGSNAQFQSFALTPEAPPATDVSVEVTGLAPSDAEVLVALGGESVTLATGGAPSVTAKFHAPSRPVVTPATAVAFAADGSAVRSAFGVLDATTGLATAAISLAAEAPGAPAAQPSITVSWPDAGFVAAQSATTSGVFFRSGASEPLRVGRGVFAAPDTQRIRWLAPAGADLALPAWIGVSVTDAAGRTTSGVLPGTLAALDTSRRVDLVAPPVPTAPLEGQLLAAGAVTLAFLPTPGAPFQRIELRDAQSGDLWEIEGRAASSAVTALTLPLLPERALLPGRSFVWTVRSTNAPGLSADDYRDEARAAAATDVAASAAWHFGTF